MEDNLGVASPAIGDAIKCDRGRGIHSNRGPLQTLTCTNIKSLRFEEGDEIQVMQEMVADAKSGITNGTVFEDEINNQIQICSDGNTEDSKDYVSVYLELVNHRQEVRALYEFSLLDQSGKNKYGALKIPRSSTTFEPESSLCLLYNNAENF